MDTRKTIVTSRLFVNSQARPQSLKLIVANATVLGLVTWLINYIKINSLLGRRGIIINFGPEYERIIKKL